MKDIEEQHNRPHRATNALLSGLMICPKCGKVLNVVSESGRWTRGRPRFKYVCPGHRKKECDYLAVDGVKLDDQVVRQLAALVDEQKETYFKLIEARIRELTRSDASEREYQETKKDIEKIKADIAAQIRNLREADDVLRKFIQDDVTEMSAELSRKEAVLQKLEEERGDNSQTIEDLSQVKKKLADFKESWKTATPEELMSMVRAVVERVYVVYEDDEPIAHIFLKGCIKEDYTSFFDTAGYIPFTGNGVLKVKTDGTDAQWSDINPSGNDTFHLEDNVTYVLKFRVWPDQDAYDTLTSIHNAGNAARDTAYGNLSAELQSKIYKDSSGKYAARAENAEEQAVKDALQSIEDAGIEAQDDAYDALDDTVKEKQIYKDTDGNYRLHTNTKASVSYDVLKRTVETPEAGQTGLSIEESGTATMDNPEGMILTDTAMKVFKVWKGDIAENLPEYVTLSIYQDGQPYQTITLPNPDTNSNTWEYTIFISPALKKTDRDAAPDAAGNYPVVTLEPGHRYEVKEVESSAVYTFEGETVHPYLLDSATEVKTDGDNTQGLTATNTIRKTTVILKKANDAEWGSADFKYLNKAHFKLLRKEVTGTGTDGSKTYRYVSYSVPDSAGNPTYPYEDFEIANGETGVTITDLPAGEYKLVELSAPDGYILIDKEIYFKVTPIDSSARLALNRYVARSGYESDADVRSAIAAINNAGTQAAQNTYAALEDTLKNKIVVDGYGEYVAKQEFEDDPEVLTALSDIRTARESAKDTYYNSDSVADDLKAKIYVSSDVIFTTSANDGTANDTMIVKNKAGRPLPNTGGAGTTNLIIIGGMLALCSIIGFIWMNVKKRKSCDTNS